MPIVGVRIGAPGYEYGFEICNHMIYSPARPLGTWSLYDHTVCGLSNILVLPEKITLHSSIKITHEDVKYPAFFKETKLYVDALQLMVLGEDDEVIPGHRLKEFLPKTLTYTLEEQYSWGGDR
jgi:hypothetical protein